MNLSDRHFLQAAISFCFANLPQIKLQMQHWHTCRTCLLPTMFVYIYRVNCAVSSNFCTLSWLYSYACDWAWFVCDSNDELYINVAFIRQIYTSHKEKHSYRSKMSVWGFKIVTLWFSRALFERIMAHINGVCREINFHPRCNHIVYIEHVTHAH